MSELPIVDRHRGVLIPTVWVLLASQVLSPAGSHEAAVELARLVLEASEASSV